MTQVTQVIETLFKKKKIKKKKNLPEADGLIIESHPNPTQSISDGMEYH